MPKAKKTYVCSECGRESARWMGRCPGCGAWNTLSERSAGRDPGIGGVDIPQKLNVVTLTQEGRISSGIDELDRVLGGGIVPGSLILLGGEPGIGKSTLLLQVAGRIADRIGEVLYVTGEESAAQLRMRAERVACLSERLYVLATADGGTIESSVEELSPALVIVDSIQTLFPPSEQASPLGSVRRVRELTAHLLRLSKQSGIPFVATGHVTKEGALAGPKVVEHLVDCVLYLEGERHAPFRLLRAFKNRYGSTNETGVFEMGESGLRSVTNPSEFFLAERMAGCSGSIVTAALEGSRAVLVEIQALAGPMGEGGGSPRRSVRGIDRSRLTMVLAVLERRAGISLSSQDIYVNVPGGIYLDEPAADLPCSLAIASNVLEREIDPHTLAVGELGLGGEVRNVAQINRRLAEARRMGFHRLIVPATSLAREKALSYDDIDVVGVRSLQEALREILV